MIEIAFAITLMGLVLTDIALTYIGVEIIREVPLGKIVEKSPMYQQVGFEVWALLQISVAVAACIPWFFTYRYCKVRNLRIGMTALILLMLCVMALFVWAAVSNVSLLVGGFDFDLL